MGCSKHRGDAVGGMKTAVIRLAVLGLALAAGTAARAADAAARAADAAKPLRLTASGQAVSAIVSAGHDKQAAILADYLRRITGAEFPIVTRLADVPEGHVAILLEITDDVPGTSDRMTGRQAYRIRAGNGALRLTGRSELALTYAVYGFLDDHLGVKFLSQDYEHVPRCASLSLPAIDDVQEPAFRQRLSMHPGELTDWRMKNRGDRPAVERLISHHNFYRWIPPAEFFEPHPEWYGLCDGKRHTHWTMPICGTNEALAEELARRLMEAMEKQPPDVPIAVGQGDGFRPCECEDCRALVEREGTEAAPQLLMLNRALERTSRRYPEHQVVTFAYFETLAPPRTMRPHDNLWINIVSSSLGQGPAGDQLGRVRGNPRNRDYQRAIEGWTALTPGRVAIWEWATQFGAPLMEWPNVFNVADNIKLYHEQGVETVYLQTYSGQGNWSWLRRWLWQRLMWDPGQDPEALAKTFLETYYGPEAAPHLWEYLQYVTKAAADSGYAASVCRGAAFPQNVRRHVFTDEVLARMDALLTRAEQAAAREENAVYHRHVAEVRPRTIDTLRMLDAGRAARTHDIRDGSVWYAPGGKPEMPALVERTGEAMGTVRGGDGGTAAWFRLRFLNQHGGPVQAIENEQVRVEVVPNMRANIVDLVHKPSGRSIFATGEGWKRGYGDEIERVSEQQWGVEAQDQTTMRLEGGLLIGGWRATAHLIRLERTLEIDEGGLIVERRYAHKPGARDNMPDPTVFVGRWLLAVPEPEAARVRVRGGGIREDLRVEEAAGRTLDVTDAQGDVVMELVRGDGLLVRITTPAAGNGGLRFDRPEPGGGLAVHFSSVPYVMDMSEAVQIELPRQRIEVVGGGGVN